MSFAEQLIPDEQKTYKKVGKVELQLHIFNPKGHKASDQRPAIVFFFGGGWHKLNGLSPNDTESKYFVDTIFKNTS